MVREHLENGRRDYLTVEELMALSAVFAVPPVVLLTDATEPTVAVTPAVEVSATTALLWQLGERPFQGMSGVWMDETVPLRLVRRLHERVRRCLNASTMLQAVEHHAATGTMDADQAADQPRVHERELSTALASLSDTLTEMHGHGMAEPDLEDREALEALAAQRGISLKVTG